MLLSASDVGGGVGVFWPVCSDVMGSCVSVRGAKMAVSVTVLLQMSI